MRRVAIAAAAAILAVAAYAVTATKEYVDRRDAENAGAATNLVIAATNTIAAAKADAVKTVSVSIGGASTNLVVRPVYANVNLIVRECVTANGQRQYRLIRREQ